MRVLATLGLLLFTACAASEGRATRVVILIDAESAVKMRASDLALIVTDLSDGQSRRVHDDTEAVTQRSFPHRIALVPSDGDAARTYRFEARAVANGQTVAVARLVSGYVADQTRYVRIVLEEACIDKECAEDQTCHAGDCVDAARRPEDFSVDEARAPVSTSVPSKHNDRGGLDGSTPESDGGLPAGDSEVADAAPLQTPADASTTDGELMTQDASSDAASVGVADAGSDGGAAEAGTPIEPGVCSGATPHGCYQLQPGSLVGCPARYPEDQQVACVSGAVGPNSNCVWGGPGSQYANCLCELTHWTCMELSGP